MLPTANFRPVSVWCQISKLKLTGGLSLGNASVLTRNDCLLSRDTHFILRYVSRLQSPLFGQHFSLSLKGARSKTFNLKCSNITTQNTFRYRQMSTKWKYLLHVLFFFGARFSDFSYLVLIPARIKKDVVRIKSDLRGR